MISMKMIKLLLIKLLFLAYIININAQSLPDTAFTNMGVAVSPSSMHISVKPGSSEQKEIKVKNDTQQKYAFQVGFSDFAMGVNGKPTALPPEENKYALSKYISLSPSYFELAPGEEMKVKLLISIPDEDDSYVSMWTIVTIEQVTERPIFGDEEHPNRLAMGIIPSFGFGVYIYQNPPNVTINKLEILNLKYSDDENGRRVFMEVKNVGDGISYCTSYLELTCLSTGEQYKLQTRRFTILPQYNRNFHYDIPPNFNAGKYSAIGVVDYGNREEILAAEIEFDMK